MTPPPPPPPTTTTDGAFALGDVAVAKDAVLDFSNLYWGDDKCAQVIAAARAAAPGPVHLDLRGNRFGAAGAKALAELLGCGSHAVASISLEWNNVGHLDEGVDALARALEVDSTLVALDLRNNNVGPEGAKALARALGRNRTLQRLDLRWNEIGSAGALAFREALQSNQSLLALEIMGNNCSLKQVDEIDRILARNQAIRDEQRTVGAPHPMDECAVASGNNCASAESSPIKPRQQDEHHGDKLLLHALAEKEELEAEVAAGKRDKQKLSERVDELEAQVAMLRKEAAAAKEDRDRFQTREADAKVTVHELKMQLDELENRRAREFDEYRGARLALEKENVLAREKLLHVEALSAKSAEQKAKQIAQLEEETFRLQGELHRSNLSLCTARGEAEKLAKQLGDAQREYERKEAGLRSSHEGELAAATRDHELAASAMQSQLRLAADGAETAQRAALEQREKAERLQAKALAAELELERVRVELKQQWEADVQARVQRTVSAVEAQLEDMKQARQHLEREVDAHLASIAQLREEKTVLQQAHAQEARVRREELARVEQERRELESRVRAAQMEQQQAEEARSQQERRFADLSRRMDATRSAMEERIQRLVAAEKARAEEFDAAMQQKSAAAAELAQQLAELERARAAQQVEHDRRVDELADAVTAFVQQQVRVDRARRRPAAPPSASASASASAAEPLESANG